MGQSIETRGSNLEQRIPHPTWEHVVRPARSPLPPPRSFCESAEKALAMLGWLGRTLQSERLSKLTAAELEHYIALDRSPLPHPETREWYWGDQHLVYWLSGLSDYLVLSDFIAEHRGVSSAPYTLLDFGCSSGRVLRHFAAYRDDLN